MFEKKPSEKIIQIIFREENIFPTYLTSEGRVLEYQPIGASEFGNVCYELVDTTPDIKRVRGCKKI